MTDKIDNAFTAETLKGISEEPMYSGSLSFARRKYTKNLTGVDLVISGIPFDIATTNRPGARLGPRSIREASTSLAWERHWPWEFDPFQLLSVIDYGDCFFDSGFPDKSPSTIRIHASTIIEQDCALLSLGGDHFISLPLLRAHVKKHGPVSLLHFDAHTDTWKGKKNRIDHGTMFYHAVKEGLVIPEESVQIGIRTTNDEPMGFNIIDASWVNEHGTNELIDRIKSIIGNKKTYLTFDIDCLDPAFAPGTGTPVCGGLSSSKVLNTLRGLRGVNLIGMDVVEVSPPYDHAEITSLIAATIAYELICLYAARHVNEETI